MKEITKEELLKLSDSKKMRNNYRHNQWKNKVQRGGLK